MEELITLKKNIRELLIAKLGDVTEQDLAPFKNEALELKLDLRQYSKLLVEINNSINWEKVRDENEGLERVVGKPINLFGQEAKSLQKLGKILLENKEKALRYLDDNIFLKENVTYLSNQNVDLTMDFLDTYAIEKNPEKRFLKIVYQLNQNLPFIINNESFSTLDEIFDRAWMQYEFYQMLYDKFAMGHLQIWIEHCRELQKELLPSGNSLKDFLSFTYSYNSAYPLYIDNLVFLHPLDLIAKAKRDIEFWPLLFKSVQESQIFIWLEKRGLSPLVLNYYEQIKSFEEGSKKNVDKLVRSSVQKLIEVIAPEIPSPSLLVSPNKLNFSGIEAKPISQAISVSLTTTGYVRASASLDQTLDGISLSNTEISFFDLDGSRSQIIFLIIEPKKLIKNKLYTINIKIKTDYQLLSIPVVIKTVFPQRAFLLCLLKYALFGGAFFALIRMMVMAAEGGSKWLVPEIAWEDIGAQVPLNHGAYIFIFLLTIISPIILWPRIKKLEGI